MKTHIQKLFIIVILLIFVVELNAQVTTASIKGKVLMSIESLSLVPISWLSTNHPALNMGQ